MASPAKPPSLLPPKPNTTIDLRRAFVSSYMQGGLHNVIVDVSWVEDGDVSDEARRGSRQDEPTTTRNPV
jgi:hypothetical protein